MKHISRQLPFCAVVFFAFCAVTFAQEKVEIKNVWSEGRYTIRQEIFNSRIDSIVETRAVVGKTQTRGQFVWQVDAAAPRADGVQVLTLKATRVALRYEQDALTPYSSDSGDMLNADDYEKNVYEIFQNSPIVVSIKDGAVLKVEGCEE
ncbi:MAG: hypothetical protein HUK22_06085, partial [Thermoguttaceae bacterium]|nr:hypothetical protein [Thermoguttaceae bacterium]